MFKIADFTDIVDGSYPAALASVEVKSGGFGGSDYRYWEWLVECKDDKGETQIVPCGQLTSMNTGPQSKSYQNLAALGVELKAGLEVEAPIGKRAVVTIKHNDKGFPKVDSVSPYIDPQQVLPGTPR